jgi:hypothetical protein
MEPGLVYQTAQGKVNMFNSEYFLTRRPSSKIYVGPDLSKAMDMKHNCYECERCLYHTWYILV